MDDRFAITLGPRTTGVVMTLGDVELAVKMPTPVAAREVTEDQIRQAVLRQLRRVLEAALQEVG